MYFPPFPIWRGALPETHFLSPPLRMDRAYRRVKARCRPCLVPMPSTAAATNSYLPFPHLNGNRRLFWPGAISALKGAASWWRQHQSGRNARMFKTTSKTYMTKLKLPLLLKRSSTGKRATVAVSFMEWAMPSIQSPTRAPYHSKAACRVYGRRN